jgi:hypothetical protein
LKLADQSKGILLNKGKICTEQEWSGGFSPDGSIQRVEVIGLAEVMLRVEGVDEEVFS